MATPLNQNAPKLFMFELVLQCLLLLAAFTAGAGTNNATSASVGQIQNTLVLTAPSGGGVNVSGTNIILSANMISLNGSSVMLDSMDVGSTLATLVASSAQQQQQIQQQSQFQQQLAQQYNYTSMMSIISSLSSRLAIVEDMNAFHTSQIASLTSTSVAYSTQIATLNATLKTYQSTASTLQTTVSQLQLNSTTQQLTIAMQSQQISQFQSTLASLQSQTTVLNTSLTAANTNIALSSNVTLSLVFNAPCQPFEVQIAPPTSTSARVCQSAVLYGPLELKNNANTNPWNLILPVVGIKGYIDVGYETTLTTVTFANLTVCASYFQLWKNPALTFVTAPLLTWIGSYVDIYQNGALTVVSLNSLTFVGGLFAVNDNGLTYLSVPSLVAIRGNLFICANNNNFAIPPSISQAGVNTGFKQCSLYAGSQSCNQTAGC